MARLLINSYHGLTYINDYIDYFGWLYTPRIKPTKFSIESIGYRIPYYADNDAFNGLNEPRYLELLRLLTDMNPVWITAPDKVGNATETNKLFTLWYNSIKQFNIAYVLQDGITINTIPWDYISCVFLGGTTEFKLSQYAYNLLIEGRQRNKLIHVGRVNSIKRIKYFWDVCDSFDGSGFSRYSKAMLPRYIEFLKKDIL